MDVSKDRAPTTNQGHEELKQRILRLDAELQVKEASLQDMQADTSLGRPHRQDAHGTSNAKRPPHLSVLPALEKQ
ncbi:hypothetical protein AAVH_13711 [Aphelenchoides avenae]|nr:hypothetical protein AAVH_13711 [Aphelenchus avenae]